MTFCTKCGKENSDTAKFCTGCGTVLLLKDQTEAGATAKKHEIYDTARKKNPNSIVWLLSAILFVASATAVYFIFFKKKTNTTETGNNVTVNDNKTEDTTVSLIRSDGNSNNTDISYTDGNGKLVFRTDCYIIVTGSFADEYYARDYVQTMKNQGYLNTGYLWIPDYPSLSGKPFYATFIGPYTSYSECENNLRYMKVNSRFWYGKKVSYNPEQIEIRIK